MKKPESCSESANSKISKGRQFQVEIKNPISKTLPDSHPAQKFHKSYQKAYDRVTYIKHRIESSMNNPEYMSLIPKKKSPPETVPKSVAKASYFPEVKITRELKEKMMFIQAYNSICEAKSGDKINKKPSVPNIQYKKVHKKESKTRVSEKIFRLDLSKTVKKSRSVLSSKIKHIQSNEDNFHYKKFKTEEDKRSQFLQLLKENHYTHLATFSFPDKKIQHKCTNQKPLLKNASTHYIWPKVPFHAHSSTSLQ